MELFQLLINTKKPMSHVQWSSSLTAGGLWILQSTNGFFLHMSVRQVKFFRKIRVALYEMEFWAPLRVTYGLVHYSSHSLPKGQFHNLVFLAPWMISKHPLLINGMCHAWSPCTTEMTFSGGITVCVQRHRESHFTNDK